MGGTRTRGKRDLQQSFADKIHLGWLLGLTTVRCWSLTEGFQDKEAAQEYLRTLNQHPLLICQLRLRRLSVTLDRKVSWPKSSALPSVAIVGSK